MSDGHHRKVLLATGGGLVLAGLLALAAVLDGSPLAVLAVPVVAVALIVISGASLVQVGVVASVAAAFTAPWNAVIIAHIRPSDFFLVVALACFVTAGTDRRAWRLPVWLLQLVVVICGVAAFHEVRPTNPAYLAGRTVLGPTGQPFVDTATNVGNAGKWLVSLVGVPLMASAAVHHRRVAARWMAAGYAAGAAVSGFVSLTDKLGLTAISAKLIVPDSSGRQAGLTVQPNHLAAGSAIAVAICIWLVLQRSGWSKVLGGVALVGAALGVYTSGSRGGAVAAALAVGLSVVLLPSLRRKVVSLIIGAGLVGVTLYLEVPGLAREVGIATRLGATGSTVSVSDQVRAALQAQAHRDIAHAPLAGIGLQCILEAHDIFLQILAAGGIVLLGSFAIFAVGSLLTALRVGRTDDLGAALIVAVVAWLSFGAVENLLTDRYLYFPVALVLALASTGAQAHRDRPRPDPDPHPATALQPAGVGP